MELLQGNVFEKPLSLRNDFNKSMILRLINQSEQNFPHFDEYFRNIDIENKKFSLLTVSMWEKLKYH